jgi:hypothetical protein
VAASEDVEVYRNKRAFPRAFLVGTARVVPDIDKMFETMRDPVYDPSREVLVEAPLPGPLPEEAPAERLGRAQVVARSSLRVVVEAESSQDCILVLADAYYPGWQARIGGKPADVFPAYYVFRGVMLPAGSHEVEFLYAPASFRWGMLISCTTLGLGGLVSAGHAFFGRAKSEDDRPEGPA